MLSNKYIATLWFALAMLALVPLPANGQTILFEDFEAGWGSWFADNGVWEVGTPAAGPASCYAGTQCAGTVLGGNYPPVTDSRLVSPTVTLPGLSGEEEIHVVFESWFSYGDDFGRVQISTWDGATGTWSDWQNVGQFIGIGSSPVWSLTGRDISAYEGETVRIAFYHTADTFGESAGWYVDDVVIVKRTPAFGGDFESGWGDWYTENGVWEVGTPTAGPAGCFAGSQCAGTVLDGNYSPVTDSRLVSPTVTLPGLSGKEEIHVVFESWFSYGDDFGQVQISTWDGATGTWSDWQNVGQFIGIGSSPVWSLTGRDISAYEGETVRIAFYHTADTFGESAGWYVDDVVIVKRTPAFGGDFESGWGDWYTENGVWEVGTPTAGPAGCFAGSQCAGTVLDGNYSPVTDSRLVSPTVTLPGLSGKEEIHVVFESWFSYGDDFGQVQISTWDGATGTWSDWQNVGQFIGIGSSPVWSLTGRDISAYEGETVRIAFYHTADTFGESAGWYVDDVVIVKRTPAFGGDFESGWGDWYTENGVWEVGTPTAGPAGCFAGSQCAGTVLDGNYPPVTDSRLISPTVTLTRSGTDPITLRFFHWFAYGDDLGRVQISFFDSGSGEWSVWTTIGPDITASSSVWSPTIRDLTAYDGGKVRIAFYHIADTFGETAGWYIDNIEITGIVLDDDVLFKDGFE